MDEQAYGVQVANTMLMGANSLVANRLSAQRQALAEAQEKRLMYDMSLRERMFQAQQNQFDLDYNLRREQIGLQEKQHELNSRYQGAQIKAFDIKANEYEAETFAAPYVTKITQDINNLFGDPDAISSYQPDLSFVDDAPEPLRPAIRAKVSLATQAYRDQALAASDENKYVSETGRALLQGASSLASAENGPYLSLKAQQLGRAMLRRQPLSEEDQVLAFQLANRSQKAIAAMNPKNIEFLKLENEIKRTNQDNIVETAKALWAEKLKVVAQAAAGGNQKLYESARAEADKHEDQYREAVAKRNQIQQGIFDYQTGLGIMESSINPQKADSSFIVKYRLPGETRVREREMTAEQFGEAKNQNGVLLDILDYSRKPDISR